MDTVEFARVVAEFGPGAAMLVEPGSSAAAHVPARWAGIAGGGNSGVRRAAAITLWNRDMLNLLPRFAAVLDECLDDVRVCLLRGDWVLLYALRNSGLSHEFRIGWDPATFGPDLPLYWGALPEALRIFLSRVHAGFADLDGVSFGPTRPRDMRTYRALNLDQPVRNWETGKDIPVDRMMLIAKGMGGTRYFVSPDLLGGTIGWEADGNMERPKEFGRTFDNLMSRGFLLQRDLPPEPTTRTDDEPWRNVRAARAVSWVRDLTEDAARERIRELVAEMFDALGGQLRISPRGGLDGETVLPFDDNAGTIYPIDRLEIRYFLTPPPPDRASIYPPLIVRLWEQRGWKVKLSTDDNGIVALAETSDFYQLTLTRRGDTLRLHVASPGFLRVPDTPPGA